MSDTEIPFTFWGFFLKFRQNRDSRGWCSIVWVSGYFRGYNGELCAFSGKRVALLHGYRWVSVMCWVVNPRLVFEGVGGRENAGLATSGVGTVDGNRASTVREGYKSYIYSLSLWFSSLPLLSFNVGILMVSVPLTKVRQGPATLYFW